MEKLKERNWLFGGENSGHILCLDRHSTGDGIVSALQVLSALREAGGTLKTLLSELTLYPQHLINVPMQKGFPWKENSAIAATESEVLRLLAGEGRVLLRASGTEPLLRVMVEGKDGERVIAGARMLADAVRSACAG
jgi:phosphoglucosamine mutase